MPKTTPLLEEFKATCRREFDYLIDEFGFAEEALPKGKHGSAYHIELPDGKFVNGFAIWFRKGPMRLVAEGVNWGLNANVFLVTDNDREVGLGHVLTEYLRQSDKPFEPLGNQLQQAKSYAKMLRQHCKPLLRGNPAALEDAVRIQREATARTNRESE